MRSFNTHELVVLALMLAIAVCIVALINGCQVPLR